MKLNSNHIIESLNIKNKKTIDYLNKLFLSYDFLDYLLDYGFIYNGDYYEKILRNYRNLRLYSLEIHIIDKEYIGVYIRDLMTSQKSLIKQAIELNEIGNYACKLKNFQRIINKPVIIESIIQWKKINQFLFYSFLLSVIAGLYSLYTRQSLIIQSTLITTSLIIFIWSYIRHYKFGKLNVEKYK
jgi:hypothetical protein